MEIAKIPLIAGHPALDFVNTVEGRGTATEVNYLQDYTGLAAWSVRAGLISESAGATLIGESGAHAVSAKKAWAGAMALRISLDSIFRATADLKAPPRRSSAEFNAILARALAHRQMVFTSEGAGSWTWVSRETSGAGLETIVWDIVFSAADLLADRARTNLIRICANNHCDWVFLDTSRNGHRRWCRMAVCGNESKVRRFRQRQKSAGS